MDAALTNRVTLVTGASGGIGSEIARAFVKEGARVAAHYGNNRESAEGLARELGPACVPFGADLTVEADVDRLFAEVEARLGPVEILVANAGFWPRDFVMPQDMTLKQWNDTLAVNLTSAFLCVRAFFRGIVKHRLTDPSAVLIGSTAGIFGEAGHGDYAAAKAALSYGLLQTWKNEICRIAPRGRMNAVCPGWTLTKKKLEALTDMTYVRKALQTIPMKKLARAEDVAKAVLCLSSTSLSGHVNGHSLVVAGGMEGRVLYAPEDVEPEKA